MKHLVPTLSAIAIMGMAPAFGASIADDLSIKPKAQIQVRAQFGASGTNAAGQDVNVFNGATADTEAARFSVRRARFGVEAKNTTGWSAVFQIRAGERTDAGTLATSKTRTAELYYANIAKTWKQDGFDVEVHGGLDKPFNNESSISSSAFLFPMDRPNAHFTEVREVGVGAKSLIAGIVRVGFDVQNGSSVNNPDLNSGEPGLFTSARIEFAPGKDFMPAKKLESWAGAEGHHLLIGLDWQSDADALTSVPNSANNNDQYTSKTTFGPDILYHFNGLSALADLRMRTTKVENSNGTPIVNNPEDVKAQIWTIQAAYAFPLEMGFAVEPAIRFSKIDLNKDIDNETTRPFTDGEYRPGASGNSGSGDEFTIGVNAYWNGHANKTQLAYTSWQGEEPASGDTPKAHVITLQQQVTF